MSTRERNSPALPHLARIDLWRATAAAGGGGHGAVRRALSVGV